MHIEEEFGVLVEVAAPGGDLFRHGGDAVVNGHVGVILDWAENCPACETVSTETSIAATASLPVEPENAWSIRILLLE